MTGVDRTGLYARANQPVGPAAQQRFDAFLGRRLRREPLQYIVGRQEFWSLDFVVTPEVLIPRPVFLSIICTRLLPNSQTIK